MLKFPDDFLFLWSLGVSFDFDLGPDEQQLEGVFDGDAVVLRFAVHEELREVEQVFAFCCVLVHGAFLVHVDEFFLGDLPVEVFIELPEHAFDLGLGHADFHFLEDGVEVGFGEELAVVGGGEGLEDLQQVFEFGGVDVELFEFFFHSLFFFGFAFLEFGDVEVELVAMLWGLLLEDDGVLVLALQVGREVLVLQKVL